MEARPSRFGTAAQMEIGTGGRSRRRAGFSAIRNNDKVGLCLFSDHVEKFIRPQKGRTHTLRLVRDVLEFSPQRVATRMDEALRYLNRVLKRKAVVFLLTDFYQVDEKLLAATAKRHDLIALQVQDPREESLPDAGLLELRDAESPANRSAWIPSTGPSAANLRPRRRSGKKIWTLFSDVMALTTSF